MNIKNKTPFRGQISLNTFFIHKHSFLHRKDNRGYALVKAVQQNNYHCDHDQSERVSSRGVGSRLKKITEN